MNETTWLLAQLLRGRTKIEIELARGVIYAVMYPRRNPDKPLFSNLLTEQSPARRFTEIVVYAPVPIIIGEWDGDDCRQWLWLVDGVGMPRRIVGWRVGG